MCLCVYLTSPPLSSLLSQPHHTHTQVLRTTIAPQSALKYNGILHCVKSIYTVEGVKGFYRGIVPTTAKSVAATALTFAAYEGVKDFLALRRERRENTRDGA
jgi:hypothetical protein